MAPSVIKPGRIAVGVLVNPLDHRAGGAPSRRVVVVRGERAAGFGQNVPFAIRTQAASGLRTWFYQNFICALFPKQANLAEREAHVQIIAASGFFAHRPKG